MKIYWDEETQDLPRTIIFAEIFTKNETFNVGKYFYK